MRNNEPRTSEHVVENEVLRAVDFTERINEFATVNARKQPL
jgi:hypothetical protein